MFFYFFQNARKSKYYKIITANAYKQHTRGHFAFNSIGSLMHAHCYAKLDDLESSMAIQENRGSKHNNSDHSSVPLDIILKYSVN